MAEICGTSIPKLPLEVLMTWISDMESTIEILESDRNFSKAKMYKEFLKNEIQICAVLFQSLVFKLEDEDVRLSNVSIQDLMFSDELSESNNSELYSSIDNSIENVSSKNFSMQELHNYQPSINISRSNLSKNQGKVLCGTSRHFSFSC